MNDLRK